MYILNIYIASFDSEGNLVTILEPKYVSDDVSLLKEKLIEIINNNNIELNAHQKKALQNTNKCIECNFDNGANRIDWDDIVGIEIKEIEQLK